ncbi:hypothetical protein AK973_1225 [Pseudomonas brassicacearum]|nr:hypothetical protein AK973_1225 [Pseudomonas brassicacearum]
MAGKRRPAGGSMGVASQPGRGAAIQPGSRALTRHRLRCWRS